MKPKFMKSKSALAFAHLLGMAAAESDDDDDRKKKDDESDDDYAKRMKALDEKDDDNDDERKQKKGESDDDYAKRMKALDDEDDAAAEDDDGDADMQGNSAVAVARATERSRCAAIFASPEAALRPDMAAHLAFNTTMSRSEAVAMLQAVGAGQRPAVRGRASLADRMAQVRTPNPGVDGGPSSAGASPARALADQIVAVGEKFLAR